VVAILSGRERGKFVNASVPDFFTFMSRHSLFSYITSSSVLVCINSIGS
jgi:hypothetical protein